MTRMELAVTEGEEPR